jgi:hypothetical protein
MSGSSCSSESMIPMILALVATLEMFAGYLFDVLLLSTRMQVLSIIK